MAHSHHDHSHEHVRRLSSLNRAFIAGILLNSVFVAAEFTAGILSNSMGLLSDAGHNLSDVASLLLALLAFRLAQVRPTSRYTYGYRRSTILVSLLNAVILLVAVGAIVVESVRKLLHPEPVGGEVVLWVAGIGVVVNFATALFFLRDKDRDLNVKGAYLHMAADALVSVGVLVSGLVISWTGWTVVDPMVGVMVSGAVMMATGWYLIDPLVGLLVAAVIVWSTWGLLRDSLRLSLDGVPAGIDYDEVFRTVASQPGVSGVHHLHVWALSTTENALTAHVAVHDLQRMPQLKEALRARLREMGIDHATLEFESDVQPCGEHADCDMEQGRCGGASRSPPTLALGFPSSSARSAKGRFRVRFGTRRKAAIGCAFLVAVRNRAALAETSTQSRVRLLHALDKNALILYLIPEIIDNACI